MPAAAQPQPRINALGAYIAQRLDDIGLGRTAFAAAVGMSRSSVYRLLGDEPPESLGNDKLGRIAEVLDVDVDDLTALWHGHVSMALGGEREDIVRAFVLSTGDLTLDELRKAMDVARAAVALARTREL